ncbi:MAG: LytTR family DNA-binding domain-containing protein [Bacteroidales bacterium]|jgi:two-component system LytT family response regulator|nr:LytTR family DNA-binding domain-containing protein [Bacteroidales bacterium]
MINAVIAEDELIQIVYLKNLLRDFCPKVKVIDTIHSGLEFVQKLSERSFELLFLDIKLGDSNAFDLLEQLPKIDFQIIIISASDQYALRAFKVNAVDYLSKPFYEDELQVSVNKAIERIKSRDILSCKSMAGISSNNQSLCISEAGSYTFIPCQNILYCKSDGNYTHLFFTNEKGGTETILATKNLMHFEQKLLFSNFIRIHQSILVNRSKIRKIQKGSRELILSDGTIHEIARDRKNSVLSLLMQ